MVCSSPYFHKAYNVYFPCGQCLPCRQKRKKNWTARMIYESLLHSNSTFLTLTYNDDNVPATMQRDDLRKFFKKLWKRSIKFRYFACGEYGSMNHRSHFHVVMFGLSVLECEKIVAECWDKGYSMSLPFEPGAAAYVAGYVSKKLALDFKRYSHLNPDFKPEFQTMSNRPGLGFGFLRYVYDILKNYASGLDDIPPFLMLGDKKVLLPKYLKNKLRLMLFTPDKIEIIKKQNIHDMRERQKAELNNDFSSLWNPVLALKLWTDFYSYQDEILKRKLQIYQKRM